MRVLFISVAYKVKYFPTVKRIPDALWNEARLLILPLEKSNNFIGRPAAVVSFRKVFYGIVYVLECLKNWMLMPMEDRCCQRSIIQVQHVIEDFSNGQYKLFERLWTRLAKKSV